MDTALALADWDGFPARRAEARRRGKLRGIGVANYVEITTRCAARAHRDHGLARRPGRAGDGHDVLGARPRDQLCAARHRMARRAVRQHRLCRPRHRAGQRRRRLAFRPLDEARRYDHRARRPTTSSPRAARSPGFLLETGEADIEFDARPLPGRRHRSRDRHLRGRRGRRDPHRSAGRICKGRSPRFPTRPCRSPAFPTARRSARSRSMPRRARSRSSATPRSTMSGAPSTR